MPIKPLDIDHLSAKAENVYEAIVVLLKRARQINEEMKIEFNQRIEMLQSRKAENVFETAQFYEKQGKNAAAKIYYNEVIEQYGKSPWAQQALEHLTILQKKSATP